MKESDVPRFKHDISLASLTSFKIGGPSRYFFGARTVAELQDALREAREQRLPLFVIGGGTNLLVNDTGFNGLVLKPTMDLIEVRGSEIYADAGATMERVLDAAITHSLSGLEWAGGLPGTIGGAVRGNAGAFRGEIKDSVKSVESIAVETGAVHLRANAECRFGYRTSIFKEQGLREIVIGVTLALMPGRKNDIAAATREKIEYRKSRHPVELPNAGSIFKNIAIEHFPKEHLEAVKSVVKQDPFPVVPAAYLISESGLKGAASGDAMVSPKHPNFIVNRGAAHFSDIETLIALVKKEVQKKFDVVLEEEVMRV